MRVKIRVKTWELPPRTRRILSCDPRDEEYHGTTSAYAENTLVTGGFVVFRGNYLRVRGEYLRVRSP